MGGSSLGSMFGGPSTMGSNVNAPANTTPSVMGATGKLEAFNPATMAGTYNTPTAPTMQDFNSAGMDAATGLPSYITNFLQQGGTGTLKAPQFTMDPGAGVEQAGTAVVPKNVMPAANVLNPKGSANKQGPALPTTAAASSTGASAPGITQVPGSGVTGSFGTAMPVSDQYNMMQGGSNQMATPAIGGVSNHPQFTAPIYSDGKGGFFYDAAGKQPMTGPALQQAQNSMNLYGHV